MMIQATQEQTTIVEAVQNKENLLISALAGTGKTTTLSLIAQAYPSRRGLYLAYNKNMQLDAQKIFPHPVVCKTINALGYQSI
jgi:Flp pilus assembly CpaF family ATPase